MKKSFFLNVQHSICANYLKAFTFIARKCQASYAQWGCVVVVVVVVMQLRKITVLYWESTMYRAARSSKSVCVSLSVVFSLKANTLFAKRVRRKSRLKSSL